jgi:hypothetical protein
MEDGFDFAIWYMIIELVKHRAVSRGVTGAGR